MTQSSDLLVESAPLYLSILTHHYQCVNWICRCISNWNYNSRLSQMYDYLQL